MTRPARKATPDLATSIQQTSEDGYTNADHLRCWFGDLTADQGSILFVRRITKAAGGFTFRAVKGFRPDQINEAVEYVTSYPDGDALFVKTSTYDGKKIFARISSTGGGCGNKSELHTVCGISMDVDAGKRDSYAAQDDVWQALNRMPALPTMIVRSGDVDHGFHTYWKLTTPIPVSSTEAIDTINQRAASWRLLLIEKLVEVLAGRGVVVDAEDQPSLVDRTFGVDRILRPGGAVRASGATVQLVSHHPDRTYDLEQLTAPGWRPDDRDEIADSQSLWPVLEESVIQTYFDQQAADRSTSVTVENLLTGNGYTRMNGQGDWVRRGCETGSRSLTEGSVINGQPGVNIFSGNCEPLKCGDGRNETGRRYNLFALWVAFTFGDPDDRANWRAAAQFCRDQTRPEADTVFDAIPDSGDQVPVICNAVRIDKTLEPRSMMEIYRQVRAVHGSWPKACQGSLFVMGRDKKVRPIKRADDLFGWLGDGAQVIWHTGANVITKGEFFRQLTELVEQYEAIETSPHFPPIERHYYVHPAPMPGDGRALEGLLNYFTPGEPVDRQLFLALIVTTFWGGKAGGRPAFAVDSSAGTGAGKTSLATKIGSLAGGIFEFDLSTPPDRLRSDLVSEPPGARRMVLLDNAKTSRVSNSAIESLITAKSISGHANYVGFRQWPNHLTWVITMNGLSLGRDMAQRTVSVLVAAPQQRAGWDAQIDEYLEVNRERLLSDVAAFFERPQVVLGEYSRLSAWEEEVLSRLTDPESVRRAIKARMGANDVDAASATDLMGFIETHLTDLGYDTSTEAIHISGSQMADWVNAALGRTLRKPECNGMLRMFVSSGTLRGLKENPSRKHGRGWLWEPQDLPASREGEALYDLETRIMKGGF